MGVHQCGKKSEKKNIFRKKASARCLDLPVIASREAMEVAAGVVHFDLRLYELATRDTSDCSLKTI